MLLYAAFAVGGVALGAVLNFLAEAEQRRRRTAGSALALMTLRLVVFVVTVGWLSRAFGPLPGVVVLVAAVATRVWLVRARARAGASGQTDARAP